MKTVVALALISSVSAFQGSTSGVKSSVALAARSKSLPFLEAPPALDGSYVGDVGFDPLGFTTLDWNMAEVIIPKKAFAATEGISMLYWMREAELKHGRICMMAIVGYLAVDAGLHFPATKFEGLTSLTAHDVSVANGSMGVMLFFVSLLELLSAVAIVQAANGSGREAGDFALDPLKFCSSSEKAEFYKTSEVIHSRLAMFAFGGLVTQNALYENTFPYIG
mmetsp:Transcript_18085/g.27274  ORF Transcript_18085/g.27274 Transcript_18085/m.27274 type:complete len:222 (-) Transcript_18085:356-1021(-)|eukprot:CAMPEP_0197349634 /NCGR_PEP_ID=MMETSP0893-20130614/10724_1 /TAXON_ID=44058 ORGANISM="Aureoumbra lagunensis, Strain CCMP1510" /NCGR_SAMPLE_ID=MMETSP0893 /ASSEMBLY_ACC=CAM_ASM_000539 /LENGTH=221 /DNA_ID=CAMNT_0042861087 /DNA_START=51 /DNA_END=716 /DNA_ORIENTATION=+